MYACILALLLLPLDFAFKVRVSLPTEFVAFALDLSYVCRVSKFALAR